MLFLSHLLYLFESSLIEKAPHCGVEYDQAVNANQNSEGRVDPTVQSFFGLIAVIIPHALLHE